MKKQTTNLILILMSLIIGIFLVELSLRLFYPRYQYAAESQFDRNSKRIWAHQANSTYIRPHPDTGVNHLVHHNNLALRQHRDFQEEDLKSAINVGFFGDSFTENQRLPSQYSFTEPLDYLLNLGSRRFNTLNFGVDAYGTDQSFLYFQESPLSKHLDYVFYIFYTNDLRNIYENNIFTADKEGTLIMNPIHDSAWWVKMVSKLHVTYLFLEMKKRIFETTFDFNRRVFEDYFSQLEEQRLQEEYQNRFHSPRADAIDLDFETGRESEDLKRTITIFQSLLRSWRHAVEKNGGKFFIVLLPTPNGSIISDFIDKDFNVIDLSKVFQEMVPNFNYSNYRFKNDGHWNEEANLLAAIALYRILDQEANLTNLPDDRLKEELFTYYSSYGPDWMPRIWIKKTDTPTENSNNVRRKYSAFEHSHLDKKK